MRRFAAVSCAIVTAAACSSFGEGDGDEPLPGPDAAIAADGGSAIADATIDASGDAGRDAGTCPRGGRDGGNTCGASTCGKGSTCCLGQPSFCIGIDSCPGTQVNCTSPNECDLGTVCCQVSSSSLGTRCMTSCTHGAELCVKDSDCKAGEWCREPDPEKFMEHWHCAPCPP